MVIVVKFPPCGIKNRSTELPNLPCRNASARDAERIQSFSIHFAWFHRSFYRRTKVLDLQQKYNRPFTIGYSQLSVTCGNRRLLERGALLLRHESSFSRDRKVIRALMLALRRSQNAERGKSP